MEDFVVPPDCIAELLQELQNIGERTGLCFRGVSHAGDGNIHLDILRNGLTDAEWERRLAEYEKKLIPPSMPKVVRFQESTV